VKKLSLIGLGFLVLLVGLLPSSIGHAKSGFYVAVDPGASFLGSSSNRWKLDPGFNINGRVGFDWGIIGLRGNFAYSRMDHAANQAIGGAAFNGFVLIPAFVTSGNESVNIYSGTADLKVKPIGFLDFFLQPYLAAGVGATHVDSSVPVLASDDTTGLTALAALGLEIYILEHMDLFIEGAYKPTFIAQDIGFQDSEFQDIVLHFATVSGGLKFVF